MKTPNFFKGKSPIRKVQSLLKLDTYVKNSAVGDWGVDTSRLRLRRSSDNAEKEFDPIKGRALDTRGILAWSGASSVFVTKIFDSTGNGNHAIQTTAAAQPRLINAGTFETLDDGSYALFYDDSDDFFVVTDNAGLDITSGIMSISSKYNPSGAGYIITRNLDDITNRQYALFFSGTGGATAYFEVSSRADDADTTLNVDRFSVATADFVNATMYKNATVADSNPFSSAFTSQPNLLIGCNL